MFDVNTWSEYLVCLDLNAIQRQRHVVIWWVVTLHSIVFVQFKVEGSCQLFDFIGESNKSNRFSIISGSYAIQLNSYNQSLKYIDIKYSGCFAFWSTLSAIL